MEKASPMEPARSSASHSVVHESEELGAMPPGPRIRRLPRQFHRSWGLPVLRLPERTARTGLLAAFAHPQCWRALAEALRRRRTNLFYRETPELWGKAFRALGGRPVTSPEEFLTQPLGNAGSSGLFEVAW